MSVDLLLHAAADFVDRLCAELDDVARVGSWTEVAGFSGRNVTQGRIAGGCNWEQSGSSGAYGICNALPGSEFGFGAGSVWNALSHSVYLRRQDGTVDYNSGGSPQLSCC